MSHDPGIGFVTENVTKRPIGRPPIGKRPMSPAERQRRHRKRVKHQEKARRREAQERALAAASLGASGALRDLPRYGVIYADPPWRFEPWSRDTGMDRAADNHYPTMTVDAIKALQIPVADDAVLFLWATVPMLEKALEVMRVWGFGYKSARIWRKPTPGTGYWARNEVEVLLIGTRGSVPAPVMGDQPHQIIDAPRRAHSEKPDAFADDIARLFPTTPKLEMFARRERPGWDCWGNELAAAE